MANLISWAIAPIQSLLKSLQVRRFLAVVLIGFLLLTTTNVDAEYGNKALTDKVRERVHQNDAQRPKTVGEWNWEARETEDAPGERLQRIGQQSGEAFKEFGSGYVEGAEKTADDVQDSAARAGKQVSDQLR
jgi:hypothetical protein